jgi:hypothetical protein
MLRGMGEDKLYQLPKSGLRLVGETLSFYEGESLIADHALQDLHEVVIRSRRDGGDAALFVFFGAILAASAAGLYFWAWRKESILGWTTCGFGAVISFLILCVGISVKSRILVLKTKSGEIVYPLKDDAPVVDAFFAEIREHAQAARLMVGFRIER